MKKKIVQLCILLIIIMSFETSPFQLATVVAHINSNSASLNLNADDAKKRNTQLDHLLLTNDQHNPNSENNTSKSHLLTHKTTTLKKSLKTRFRVGKPLSTIYVEIFVDCNISAGTGWAQINHKPSKVWQSPDSSDSWRLKHKVQSISNTHFPTSIMGINITGTAEISKSAALNNGLSFDLLTEMGFEMSGTAHQSWSAIRAYNTTVYVKTMW